jgi:hypothetical protein
MSLFRRLIPKRAAIRPAVIIDAPRDIPGEIGIKRTQADINIKHNLAVQRFSKAPYNLKTRVAVVSHNEGYLATLEWRWIDPGRDGRTIVAVTSGINSSRKVAISEAYRAMLTQQKLLDDSDTAQKEAIVEVEELMKEGHLAHACKALLQSSINSSLPVPLVSTLLMPLWRSIVAMNDNRLVDMLITVLEQSESGVPINLYDNLLQELVYISSPTFAGRVLQSLTSDRIKLEIPERGFVANGDKPSREEVDSWKKWRSLLAIEESANIQSALSSRDTLPNFRMSIDSVTVPVVKLCGWVRDPTGGLVVDSLVLIASPTDRSVCLTAKISESVTRPDGNSVVTMRLLTEESKYHDKPFLFSEKEVDLIVLSESRVTFDRMSNSLGEYFRVSSVPDSSFRFSAGLKKLINLSIFSKASSPRNSLSGPPPDLTYEKRFLNLSDAQLSAVISSLSNPLTLIHGPAGTGKTHTLCGIVSVWRKESNDKILACADSNTAVDNIYNALRRRDIPCFRLGAWKALSDVSEETLVALPNKALVDKYRGAVNAFKLDPIKHKGFLIGLRKQIEEEAINHFQVVVTTLSSSRNPLLDRILFPKVVIDEAAQQIEPATLMPLSHGCDRLVLIGDHKQLPAVVLSREAKDLNVSMFERLTKAGHATILLNVQRRMHPSIVEWPNRTFYEGKLDSHESMSKSSLDVVENFDWLSSDSRVVFVNAVGSGEELVGTSTRNRRECEVLGKIVDKLITGGVAPDRVGIIVPYLAQKASLGGLFPPNIQVNTVEGFQGHEKDFIIISTTRSNVSGSLGFLEDDQRMNVMLTRARKAVIIVGDAQTLRKKENTRWREYVEYLEGKGAIFQVSDFI